MKIQNTYQRAGLLPIFTVNNISYKCKEKLSILYELVNQFGC